MDGQHGERFFWCAKHQRAERTGEVVDECLLVGPYSTKEQAEEFAGGSAFLCKLDKSACDHDWNNEGINPANGLSVSEAERLALLLEEAGEVVQAIGKVLRHGYESWNPNDPRRTSNRESLERELGDMAAAIQLMTGRRDLNAAFIKQCQVDKLKKVGQYLHHQPSEG